jgi:hypothetical protein
MRSWPKNGSFSNTKVGTLQWPDAAWACSRQCHKNYSVTCRSMVRETRRWNGMITVR